ncbi:MAG: repair protein SbcD/Mre11 [Synergistaceae bacterium]|nr:repair protein SbcD/Mre11 [Synergistaceae bacterium]
MVPSVPEHVSFSLGGEGEDPVSGRKISFVHCADLHLDSPFSGLSDISPALGAFLRKATFRAFENAVTFALKNRADFFVISGDVYDSEDRSVRAQVFFLEQLGRLSAGGIPSFIAAGNHDSLSGWEADRDFPPLAFRFGPGVESVPLALGGETAGMVHGFSYPVRDVEENMALRFAGRKGEGLNIALLHCNVGGRKGHENYAPCSLDDLRAAGMDYWALGHVHGAEVLCRDPLVVYPGNIQGRNIRETGKKGVFYVTLSPGEPGCAEFVPCDVVRWRSEDISIDGMDRDEEFFQAVSDLKEAVRRENGGRPALLRLSISGRGKIHGLLRRPGFLRGPGGLLEAVNEGEEDREDFVFTEEISGMTAPPLDLDSIAAGSHFAGDFLKEVRAFRKGGDLREGLKNILRERGILDKIPSRDVLEVIDSLSEEDAELLLDKGTYSALSGLLEGVDGL